MTIQILRPAAAALLIAVAPAAPAVAQTAPAGISVGVTGGTLGIGPEIAYRGRMFGVRGNATFLSFDHGFNSDDIDYDGSARLRSAGIMIDVYPGGGGFRLSAGGRVNGNRARVTAMPTGNAEVGGTTYTPAQIGTLRSRGTVRNVAPALTLGYSAARARGFVFGAEAGAMYQGRIRIAPITSSSGLAADPRFQASLERERQSLQDDVNDYKVYPILQLSVGWRF